MLTTLLIKIMVLLFPLIINLFYLVYADNLKKEKTTLFLDFSLLSSLYLLYYCFKIEQNYDLIIITTVPLLISFFKKRIYLSIILSLIILSVCFAMTNMPLVLLILEFIIYYCLYFFFIKYKNKENYFYVSFIIVKVLFCVINFLCYENHSLKFSLILILLYIIATKITLYIFKICENIMLLTLANKELEKEKKFRESLFKITHEIKNPLAVCKTYLDIFDSDNKEHLKYIPIIKEEIEKTLLLLQDFLCMNKIKVNLEIMDINMLLEDISSQFKTIMKSNQIRFKYNLIDDEIYINGDYNRLSQVFINVLKNAIEAVDKNKHSNISLITKIKNNKLKIIIWDNGIGMNEEVLGRITEPFYTNKKNGTGLGVSLSSEIIKAHGGKISYYSKENLWTKVEIILPLINLS